MGFFDRQSGEKEKSALREFLERFATSAAPGTLAGAGIGNAPETKAYETSIKNQAAEYDPEADPVPHRKAIYEAALEKYGHEGAATLAIASDYAPGLGGASQIIDAGEMFRNSDSIGGKIGATGLAALGAADLGGTLVGTGAVGKGIAKGVPDFMRSEYGGAGPRSKGLPNLRGLHSDEAVKIARKNPHLIESGKGTEGKYVGGPRNVQSRQDLTNIRRSSDKPVEAGAEGGD